MKDTTNIIAMCDTMPITNSDVAQKIILLISDVAATAETFDELFSFEDQLVSSIVKRKIDAISPTLNSIEQDSHINTNSLIAWNQLTTVLNSYNLFFLQAETALCAGNKARLAEKEGISIQEANQNHPHNVMGEYNTIFESASRILENMITYYNTKVSIQDEQFQQILRAKLGVEAVLVHSMLEYIISKDWDKCSNTQWLLAFAKCQHFQLTAHLFHNGQAYSFMIKGREDSLQKLVKIYSRIQTLDPDFEIPELPDPIGVNVPEENSVISEQSSSSGGCYVATAVYGSYDCPQVWTLRRYRDYTLAETWYGRAFIRTYYAISPTLVKWFGHTEWFKKMWKGKLDRMVANLNTEGVENTPYQDRNW